MIILALDIATKTGWAVYDTSKPPSAIRVGVIATSGETHEQKAALLAQKLVDLIKAEKPQVVWIEEPVRNVMPQKRVRKDAFGEHEESTINAGTALLVNQLTGAAIAIVAGMRLPWGTVASGTWRKTFLGFGRQRGWTRKDWKNAAREKCGQLGIVVTNDDQADAVGVAFAAAGIEQKNRTYAESVKQETML